MSFRFGINDISPSAQRAANDADLSEVREIMKSELGGLLVSFMPDASRLDQPAAAAEDLFELTRRLERAATVEAKGPRIAARLAIAYPTLRGAFPKIGRSRRAPNSLDDLIGEIANQFIGRMAEYFSSLASYAKLSPPHIVDISRSADDYVLGNFKSVSTDVRLFHTSWSQCITLDGAHVFCQFTIQESGKDELHLVGEMIRGRSVSAQASSRVQEEADIMFF